MTHEAGFHVHFNRKAVPLRPAEVMAMIQILLITWIACALLIIREHEFVRMIIYLSVYSLISPVCFFLLAAPDIAMAGIVVNVFTTIIYIISIEKYYSYAEQEVNHRLDIKKIKKYALPVIFTLFLFVLFIWFIPKTGHLKDTLANSYLKDQYLSEFQKDFGGKNAVTAIYLGYRLYDTLFETLMLMTAIAAIIHLSWYKDFFVSQEIYIGIQHSQIAADTIRIVCPILLLFSFYLMINGHISPGGGFQGGIIAASFFMCRYMIHDIYDIPIGKVIKLEKFFYIGIVLLALLFLSFTAHIYFPEFNIIYLVLMNLLIGFKVACGFVIIFFRFIAFERR